MRIGVEWKRRIALASTVMLAMACAAASHAQAPPPATPEAMTLQQVVDAAKTDLQLSQFESDEANARVNLQQASPDDNFADYKRKLDIARGRMKAGELGEGFLQV